jgi:hypothetical protein
MLITLGNTYKINIIWLNNLATHGFDSNSRINWNKLIVKEQESRYTIRHGLIALT